MLKVEIDKIMIKNFFGYHDPLKIYGAPKLCTETTVSNPPVVFPKSSCDVHLLRCPCFSILGIKHTLLQSLQTRFTSLLEGAIKEFWSFKATL